MPTLNARYCLSPGCKNRTSGAWCDDHRKSQTADKDRARGSRHKRGYGTKWDKLRKRVLARDNYACRVCMQFGMVTTANEVDHIIPKAKGGSDHPSNLQAICHAVKTAEERNYG